MSVVWDLPTRSPRGANIRHTLMISQRDKYNGLNEMWEYIYCEPSEPEISQ